jgi:hypothetical protein
MCGGIYLYSNSFYIFTVKTMNELKNAPETLDKQSSEKGKVMESLTKIDENLTKDPSNLAQILLLLGSGK